MNETTSAAPVRAEYDSLPDYLREHLDAEQLSRPLIVSFSQWEMNTSVVAEVAATAHAMALTPTVALWADETPLRDVGWTTSHALAKLFCSPARDQRVEKALRAIGLPPDTFARPPIRKWSSRDELPKVDALHRSGIRELTYRGAPVGRAILQVHPDDQTPVTDDHRWPQAWVEACVSSFAFVYDQVRELIRLRHSTALVVFNGRFLHDAATTAAAEACGVPVLSFDFGGNETDYDLTVDETHDWSALQTRMKTSYSTWALDERDELGSRWFEDRRHHADARNARFVESQVVGRGIELPEDRTIVVFFSSSGDEVSELDVDWSDYFYGQTGALDAVAQVCRKYDDLLLIVRTHPHKRMKPRRDVEEWHEAVQQASPDLHLDEWSDVDSYTLMDQADVVVTFGSTTGVEAAYANKPVIVLGPSAYDELGCVSRVKTLDELETSLTSRSPGSKRGALAYGLMMMRRGFQYKYVTVNDDGSRSLGTGRLLDSRPVVLKLSDAILQRSRLRLIS